MSKIKINTILKKNNEIKEYKTYGLLKENTITYYEDKTKVKLDKKENEIHLLRRNEDGKLLFIFKNQNSVLIVETKEGKFTIPINIKQKKWNKNNIKLKYEIEEEISFELIWEECL